jgi:hypothetical protein
MSINGSCSVIYNIYSVNWILRDSCTYILRIAYGGVSEWMISGCCVMVGKAKRLWCCENYFFDFIVMHYNARKQHFLWLSRFI